MDRSPKHSAGVAPLHPRTTYVPLPTGTECWTGFELGAL